MNEVERIECPDQAWRDHRGWGLNPFLAAGFKAPESTHVVSIKPRAVRGNHVHPHDTEWMLVCEGPARLVWQAPGQSPREERIESDRPALFRVPSGVAHAVQNLCERDIIVISFSDAEKPDQHRFDPPLISPLDLP